MHVCALLERHVLCARAWVWFESLGSQGHRADDVWTRELSTREAHIDRDQKDLTRLPPHRAEGRGEHSPPEPLSPGDVLLRVGLRPLLCQGREEPHVESISVLITCNSLCAI